MFSFIDTFAKWMTFKVLGSIPSVDKEKLAQVKEVVTNETTPVVIAGAEVVASKVSSWMKWIKYLFIGIILIAVFIFSKTLYNKLNRK